MRPLAWARMWRLMRAGGAQVVRLYMKCSQAYVNASVARFVILFGSPVVPQHTRVASYVVNHVSPLSHPAVIAATFPVTQGPVLPAQCLSQRVAAVGRPLCIFAVACKEQVFVVARYAPSFWDVVSTVAPPYAIPARVNPVP